MDGVRTVDPVEARDLAASGALLLDVRTDDEWAAGRAPGAVHLALFDLPDRVGELDPDVAVVCVCRVGARSARAAEFLAEQGYTAANLAGGMVAWSAAGLELVGDGPEAAVV